MQYTNKDYESIFEYLKSIATKLSDGQWTDFTDGDFGTIVIHLLSYWGDLLSNQLDLTASELFLSTAEERTSLMEIVKLIGYEPSHFQSAIAYEHLTYNKKENAPFEAVVLPAFTEFVNSSENLSYYNLYPTTLSDETTIVTLYEGTKASKNFYYDDIDEYGRISLGEYYVGTNTVMVNIANGSISGEIPRVADVRFTTGDMCFSVHVDLDGIPYIQLPTFWSNVVVDGTVFNVVYLKTNGAEGRVGANTITRVNSNVLENYTITNPEASVGGYNPETVNEMKAKAGVFARTMYSIVTLKDFEDMSIFVNDIMQVKALDYNNDEKEFPPSIPAYKQPSPPNGVPNDAYKVLIMAVPSDLSVQSIFTEEDEGTYSKLTAAAKQLHDLYMDRKSATLYVEYRDPVYINPWLIMNVYLDEQDLHISAVAQNIVDYLKILYNRGRVKIGESIYGSVIGKEILNQFPYVNYIEVRDPEYNIEAKPYEYVDINNGYHQIFVNDSLKYVPKGLQLIRIGQYESVRLKEIESGEIKEIEWCPSEVYDKDKSYVPNSYKYVFDKTTGDYPRLDLEKVGVLYEDKKMVMAVPDEMLEIGAEQTFTLNSTNPYLHVYTDNVGNLIEYREDDGSGAAYDIPSYITFSYNEEGEMELVFSTSYKSCYVNKYQVELDKKITITKPNGDVYEWTYKNGTEPIEVFDQVYYISDGLNMLMYVPNEWDVKIG